MNQIKLECRSLGFNYGDVVKVGNKKEEISVKQARELVAGGLAKEVKTEVAKPNESEFKKEVIVLENIVKTLEADKVADAKKIGDLENIVKTLKAAAKAK